MQSTQKQKNNYLHNKLCSYSLMAAAFIATAPNAEGQIIYTDITDTTIYNPADSLLIDIDNDGTRDITFRIDNIMDLTNVIFTSTTNSGTFPEGSIIFRNIYAQPNVGNAIAGNTGVSSSSLTLAYPFALNSGDVVDSALTFNEDNLQSMAYDRIYKVFANATNYFIDTRIARGAWLNGKQEKFVGVKFISAGATYYGWVRCTINADNDSLTVLDYAYNASPQMPISAGQTTGGVAIQNTSVQSDIDIYCFNNILHIRNIFSDNSTQIKIINTAGEIIYNGLITKQYADIELNDAQGIYIVQVTSNNKVISKKILIN